MKRIDFLLGFAACCFALVMAPGRALHAKKAESAVVIFSEAGFPSPDSAAPLQSELSALVPGARLTSADELGTILAEPATHLLILPYDSAYPESAWPEIYAFLARGGNLIVLGGRPFTRAAYHDMADWHLRDYSVRHSH